ncbi:MAG: DUF2058 family protein [Luteimonas sp.]
MSDSLRDQLLGLGFKSAPKPTPRPDPQSKPNLNSKPNSNPNWKPNPNPNARAERRPDNTHGRRQGEQPARPKRTDQARPNPKPAHTREEIDLAKAYAIRAQKEKDERIQAERLKQDEARLRREAKARLSELLKDKALNDPAAEIARHFNYGGKIKRVHVTEEQLKALNAGELGVVQLDGRYLLIAASLMTEAEMIFAPAIALKVDPDALAEDDPFADPKYQVPDDLLW